MAKCPQCGHVFEEETVKAPTLFANPNTRSIFSNNSASIFPNRNIQPRPIEQQPTQESQPTQETQQPQQSNYHQPQSNYQQPSYQQPQSNYNQSSSEPATRQMQHIAITTGNRTISPEEQEKRRKEQESAARILSFAAQGKKTR